MHLSWQRKTQGPLALMSLVCTSSCDIEWKPTNIFTVVTVVQDLYKSLALCTAICRNTSRVCRLVTDADSPNQGWQRTTLTEYNEEQINQQKHTKKEVSKFVFIANPGPNFWQLAGLSCVREYQRKRLHKAEMVTMNAWQGPSS